MNIASRELSDWLSPMIVKELRQGMRGRTFLTSFLLLQVAMIIATAGALVAASLNSTDQFTFFSTLFWFIIGVPLVFIIPSLGSKAMRDEFQTNSLELVYLTRLTPWRIVTGKWAALFAQSLLFVFAVLPYLVLRYFLGGIDLVNEMIVLGCLLLACSLLTALSVSLASHNTNNLTRGGQVLAIIIILQFGMAFLFSGGTSFFYHSTGSPGQNPLLLMAVFSPLVLLLFFEIGTRKIAPAAEPRSFQFRALGLLFLLVGAILDFAGDGQGLPLFFALPAVVLIGVMAVCESPRWIKSIYSPYVRRGWLGRMAGKFLFYPGWPSGVVYVTVTLAILALLSLRNSVDLQDDLLFWLVLFSAIVFPVAVTRLIRPATPRGFPWFLGCHLVMLLIAILVYLADEAGIHGFEVVAIFMPTALALLLGWDVLAFLDLSLYAALTTVTISLCLLALFIRAFPLFARFRKMEQPAPKPEVLEA